MDTNLNKNVPFQGNLKINHLLTDDNKNFIKKKNSTKYTSQNEDKIKLELSPHKMRSSFSNANNKNNKILITTDFSSSNKDKINSSTKKILQKKNQNKIVQLLRQTEKSKIPHNFKKEMIIPIRPSKLESPPQNKIGRVDKNGITINKINKKLVHITFIDKITQNNLIETVPVESYKKYNSTQDIPKNELFSDQKKCCFIF